jgi:hypothetical protein
MAGKFVDLKEAAKILGVTAEELVDMRSRGEIFGYRDGASWKFKIEEVERVASERSAAGKSGSGVLSGGDDDDFGDFITGSGKSSESEGDDSADSVLVSDDPAAASAIGKQSTVIGKELRGKKPEDSDLKLASDGGSLAGAQPSASLSGISRGAASDESYDLASDELLNLGDSKKGVAGGSSKKGSGLKSSSNESDLKLKEKGGSDILDADLLRSGSGTGVLGEQSEESVDLDIASGANVYELSEDAAGGDDESISLDEPALKKGPGTGSDVTYTPGDSGINLRSPADSGLSLEDEPLDLGGSGVDQLELPEDEDVIALEEDADPDMATQLKADEAFSLSPAALDGGGDDDSDSGSQVIALEDSSAFDQNAATMLNQGGAPLLAEGAFQEVAMPGFDMGPAMVPGAMGAAQPYVAAAPAEAPYSVWNVLGLMSTAGVLALAGMLMWDVMLNLWSHDTGTTVSTSLMDSIVAAVGLK